MLATASASERRNNLIGAVAVVLTVLIAVVIVQNILLRQYFPHLKRVATDFSPAYLQRELDAIAANPRQVVFLGDSVLWGYALDADQTAVSLLDARGCACRNLAFKAGGPVNEYALALLFAARHIRPQAVVIEINQRTFNPGDAMNAQLHPAIADLAGPLLSPEDRALLSLPDGETLGQRADRTLNAFSALYAMRADIRETLVATPDELPGKPLTAADFEGTYDLEALNERNVPVRFLAKALSVFRAEGVPVVAFMTPVNHALLHEYVDTPEYRANDAYLRGLLERNDARVVDLDAAFPASDFLDNDHLTQQGQHRLASVLAKEIL